MISGLLIENRERDAKEVLIRTDIHMYMADFLVTSTERLHIKTNITYGDLLKSLMAHHIYK